MIVLALVLGALTWSLLEYLIHRFLGHEPKLRPNPFASEHVRHHSEGDYFAPTWKKLLAAVVFTAVLSVPVTWLLGVQLGLAYLGGLMGFYGTYEVLHRREHTHAGGAPTAAGHAAITSRTTTATRASTTASPLPCGTSCSAPTARSPPFACRGSS